MQKSGDMAYRLFFILVMMCQLSQAQVFLPSLAANANSRNTMMLDYQIFSTHGGTGLTNQYAINPTTKAEFDRLFDTSNSNTILHASGKSNNLLLFDWDSYADLTSAGINIPNSGNYFAVKISGNFTPTESGTYTFVINGDDGVDLYIDNTRVIDYYGNHSLTQNPFGNYIGNITMTAGKSYRFELRMQEASGGEGLQLYWKPPSSAGAESGGYKKNFIQRADEVLTDRFFDGSSAVRAAPSAQYIKSLTGTNTDGVYWINLPVVGPTQIYCIMNSAVDGGGWMMMMKATTGTTFNYDANYWTTVNTLNPSDNTRNNADAKFHTMNYFPAKDLLALWPDITTAGGSLSLSSYGCWSWLQNNFNNGIRVTPIYFWANVDRLFLGDANNFAGKGTAFSSQADVRFYGFNFRNSPEVLQNNTTLRVKARWGFGWNENGGGLYPNGNMESDDVSGGIGVKSDRVGTYSAGDIISCCQNYTGINRTARVEIYVR